VVPYLLASDVLVSDASSVIFEFLALDRPVVLVTNPRRAADPAWVPDDIVWRWRDLGDEIHDVRELPAAVADALRLPDRHAERRRAYGDLLFGRFTDGRSHWRIAERLLDAGARVLGGAHRVASRPPRVAFLAHDLRTVLGGQAWARRLFLVPLERARLAARGWRRPPSRVAAGGTALFPG
jgi:CDP-glycerol glycerophosphotransferase (TagB/SpsB family)